MLTVHHLNNSRSQRILWLLEEMGVPYEIKHYQRDAKTMLAPPELKAIHPLGKSPVLTEGTRVVAESGAIIEYLVDHAPQFRPSGEALYEYRYWLHYAEGSLMPFLVMRLVFSQIPKKVPFFLKPIGNGIVAAVNKGFLTPNLGTQLQVIDQHLANRTWFLGDELSGVDAQMSFPLQAAMARVGDNYPNIKRYVQQIEARPAYQRALRKGGPLVLM